MHRHWRTALVVLLVLSVAIAASACGSPDDTAGAPDTSVSPPADGITSTTTATPDAELCPGPDPARLPSVHSPADAEREGARQDVLRGDLERARQYGEAHADAFNDVWLDYRDGEWIVVVGFTKAVAEHRSALQAQVEHPDRLLVCRSLRSNAEKMKILDELAALNTDGQLSSWGANSESVFVNLRADQEKLAQQLYEKYSPGIDITVGARPYPPGSKSEVDNVCPELLVVPAPAGVRITVEPASPSFISGTNSKATVRIRNTSSTSVAGSQGMLAVVRPGTHTVVGVYVGARDLMLRTFDVAAGGEGSFDDTFGTAPCGPGDGYTLPKGTYELIATVLVTGVGTVQSDPARIVLT